MMCVDVEMMIAVDADPFGMTGRVGGGDGFAVAVVGMIVATGWRLRVVGCCSRRSLSLLYCHLLVDNRQKHVY